MIKFAIFFIPVLSIQTEIDLAPLSKVTLNEQEYIVTPENFMKEVRPHHQLRGKNAAIYYIKAMQKLKNYEKELEEDIHLDIKTLNPNEQQKQMEIENKLLNNFKLMDDLNRAYELQDAKWPIFTEEWPPSDSFISAYLVLPTLGGLHDIMNLQAFLARQAYGRKDLYTGFEYLKKMETLTQHLKQHNHILINGLVYITMKSIFFDTANMVCQLFPNNLSLHQKITELVNKNKCEIDDALPFLEGEKYFCLTSLEEMIEKPEIFMTYLTVINEGSVEINNIPLKKYEILKDFMIVIMPEKSIRKNIIDYFNLIETIDPNEPLQTFVERLDNYEENLPEWDFLSNLVLPQLGRAVSSFARLHQHQKLFQIAKEIFRYKQQHQIWPENLETLSLSQDQTFDLFSGNQLIFKSEPQPLLYSVGQNGKDDFGDQEEDIVFRLTYTPEPYPESEEDQK
jgi:hypothetical protein